MAEEQKTFESAYFIVDGKTVDANGKEVKVSKAQAADTDADESDTDDKPAARTTKK